MAKIRNLNPENSSVKQSILDVIKTMKMSNNPASADILKGLKFALDNMNKQDFKDADIVFEARRYNDDNLSFVKFYNDCEIWESLSVSSCRILLRMCRKMSQDNCYLLDRDLICKLFHMSKRSIITAVNELETMGCIVKLCTFKKEYKGTLYMINPLIASVGKKQDVALFEKIASDDAFDSFEFNSMHTYDTILSRILFNNRTLRFNCEAIIQDET